MWHDIFRLKVSATEKVVRTVLIYVFLVAALRVVGKRELGQANTLDLVVLLLVANAVQNGIIDDDVSVTGAVIGAVTCSRSTSCSRARRSPRSSSPGSSRAIRRS